MRVGCKMIIRDEKPEDIRAITEVTEKAFEDYLFDRQTQPFIIQDLRSAGALTISLVSEVKGSIVGYIAFSPVTITDGTTNWYGLGPVSVLPNHQGQRIGSALVRNGLNMLRTMGGRGCALMGLPTYYHRFGFCRPLGLIHESGPQEIFSVKVLSGHVPCGTLEFHQAFKQLSIIEKDAVADAIVDYKLEGIHADLTDPAVEKLMEKGILTRMPGDRLMLRPSALAVYDSYFGKIAQFRAEEMGRVHKNPLLTAITTGTY